MKSASAALKALIPSTRAFVAWHLFTITPNGGSALRYTDCDQDILWNSNTYSGRGPFVSRSNLQWAVGLTVDKLSLNIDARPDHLYNGSPILKVLALGIFDGARFQLDRLFGKTYGSWVDSVTLFAGNIADIKGIGRTRCSLEVRSRLELLNNSLPRFIFQPSCRWSLFDAGCTLLRSGSFAGQSFQQTGKSVNSVVTQLTLQTNLTWPDGYADLGYLTFTSGLNSGLSATIKQYKNASGTVTLNKQMPFPIANGDTFNAFAGCDKSNGTCASKFNNLINIGDYPYIPVPETAF